MRDPPAPVVPRRAFNHDQVTGSADERAGVGWWTAKSMRVDRVNAEVDARRVAATLDVPDRLRKKMALLTHPWVGSRDQVGSGRWVSAWRSSRSGGGVGTLVLTRWRGSRSDRAQRGSPLPAGEVRGTPDPAGRGDRPVSSREGREREGGALAPLFMLRLVGFGRAVVGIARRGRAWPGRSARVGRGTRTRCG
jgi:hypothetical protein